MNYKELSDLVYNYPTKHKEGFIISEEKELLSKFPDINMGKYNDVMMGSTCMWNKEDGTITYHCDILKALNCGIENRDLTVYEWD